MRLCIISYNEILEIELSEAICYQTDRMGSRSAMNATDKKLLDNLQSDLRQLSNEAKRKFPAVKEVSK